MTEGDFYYDLVARGYDHYLADVDFGDLTFFRDIIVQDGRSALELACGTGRLLLPLCRGGLDVHGLDSSPEMLALCREKAVTEDVTVRLYEQPMQDFRLPVPFGTIFCAVGSFSLLVDDDDVTSAIAACRRHLIPSGQLVLAFAGSHRAIEDRRDGDWRLRREVTDESGRLWSAWERVLSAPEDTIVQSEWRYELSQDGVSLGRQKHMCRLRRWKSGQLRDYLLGGGFVDIQMRKLYSDEVAGVSAGEFMAVATRG